MGLLSNFFELIKIGGLPFLFLLVLVEGNPILGSFVPGQIIVVFVGAMISAYGLFDINLTILVVFIGAFIGDLFGYYLGKKYGIKGLSAFGLDDKSRIYRASYNFFEKYGSWSIFLGREFNLTRAFMPFFAGSFKMNFFKFLLMAFFSCAFWAIFSVYLGYYFGFIIVENFNFIMEFFIFLVLYLVFVIFIYKGLLGYFNENKNFLRRYAVHSFIFLGFLISLFVVMIFLNKWGFNLIINDYFFFLYLPSFYFYFSFLISGTFFFIYFLILFFILLYYKNYRMLSAYLWSLFILFLSYLMIRLFLMKWFGIVPFFSIILFTVFIFYFWAVCEIFFKKTKAMFYINLVFTVMLIVVFITKFSMTSNFFMVLFSFLIGVIICEFLWLFSYYSILDRCLYECRIDEVD